jgi:siderophore synthetase component
MSDEQHPATTSDDLVERLLDTARYASESEAEAQLRRLAVRKEAAARLSALERQVGVMKSALGDATAALASITGLAQSATKSSVQALATQAGS